MILCYWKTFSVPKNCGGGGLVSFPKRFLKTGSWSQVLDLVLGGCLFPMYLPIFDFTPCVSGTLAVVSYCSHVFAEASKSLKFHSPLCSCVRKGDRDVDWHLQFIESCGWLIRPTSSLNCLACRTVYHGLQPANASQFFQWRARFFADICFVASPSPQFSLTFCAKSGNLVFWQVPHICMETQSISVNSNHFHSISVSFSLFQSPLIIFDHFQSLSITLTWWTFRIFVIFVLFGEGEGGARGARKGDRFFFFRKSQEGGGFPRGGRRGREGVCGELGNLGGGAKYFFPGRNVHQVIIVLKGGKNKT